MKVIKIALLCLMPFQVLWAQNEKPLREAFTLQLAVDQKTYYEQEIAVTPYFVQDLVLQIFPSEEIFIEVEVENDSIKTMKTVRENLNPQKTITLHFYQTKKDKSPTGMFLKVYNPFDEILHYEALMFVVGDDRLLETSIIPVSPQLTNYETWHDAIVSLVLVNWRLE